MQLKGLVISGIALASLGFVTVSCRADFLHKAYQGHFTKSGYTYTVSTDGSISVTKDNKCSYPSAYQCFESSCSNYATYLCNASIVTFKDVNELDTVMDGLKKVSDAIHTEENSK